MAQTTKSADARPVGRQTYGYPPSFGASPPFNYSTELYCLVTEAGVRERLIQSHTWHQCGWESNPRPLNHKSAVLSQGYQATHQNM